MRHIGDEERRARLARGHAIAPGTRVADPVAAARAMTVLHATEAAAVYLSLFARVPELTVADVDRVLYEDRSLVKQLAMRRTVFVFPRELLPAAWGSAAARVADQEWRKTAKAVVGTGLSADGDAWLHEACAAVLEALREADGLSAAEVRARVPAVAGKISVSPGTKWGGEIPVAPRVLTILGARGVGVRGVNGGHWRTSRPTWTPMERWLGEVPDRLPEDTAYAELVRCWLRTFGPGTTADVKWWLGSTVSVVKRALADVAAVGVSLDNGGAGWVLPDDLEPVPAVESWAALLPVLDPTTMGWKERDFYLAAEHTPYLFDSNGNGGTTAWWEGRIVGCWVQDEDGAVSSVLREDIGADGVAALAAEEERLTAWLDGTRISSVYSSLQMKSALLP